MSRPQLKLLVADVAFEEIIRATWERVNAIGDVRHVHVEKRSDLAAMIRVETGNDGVHFYEVSIKEKM